MVMGEEPLESCDAMISELYSQGLETVAQIYNTAYERYKANAAA